MCMIVCMLVQKCWMFCNSFFIVHLFSLALNIIFLLELVHCLLVLHITWFKCVMYRVAVRICGGAPKYLSVSVVRWHVVFSLMFCFGVCFCNNISWRYGTHIRSMALGPGANVRACELEAPCSSPCRGFDTADLFRFKAYNEAPPWGPRMSLIDPNATVLGTCAAAFLFLDGSAVFVLRARGSRDIHPP